MVVNHSRFSKFFKSVDLIAQVYGIQAYIKTLSSKVCSKVLKMESFNVPYFNVTILEDPFSLIITMEVNYFLLARQAIPLRGNWKEESAAESDSNFYQLLMLRTEEDKEILKWLDRKQQKYTSPDIQNEMIEVNELCRVLFMFTN